MQEIESLEPFKINKVVIWIFRILGIVLIVGGLASSIYAIYMGATADTKYYFFLTYYGIAILVGTIMTIYGFMKNNKYLSLLTRLHTCFYLRKI